MQIIEFFICNHELADFSDIFLRHKQNCQQHILTVYSDGLKFYFDVHCLRPLAKINNSKAFLHLVIALNDAYIQHFITPIRVFPRGACGIFYY